MDWTLTLDQKAWAVLHGMLMEDPIPRRAQQAALRQFEDALQAAQKAFPDTKPQE